MTSPSYLPLEEKDISQLDQGVVEVFRSNASWIWTPETLVEGGPPLPDAPSGEQRAFRKTLINPAPNKVASNATLIIAVDNYYTVYVNGILLHAPNKSQDWYSSLAFTFPVYGDKAVFAIRAINLPSEQGGPTNPAGLRAAIKLSYRDDERSSHTLFTGSDQTWLGERIISEGWEKPDFDDRDWVPAFVYSKGVESNAWSGLKLPSRVLATTTLPTQASQSSPSATVAVTTAAVSGGGVSVSGSEFAGLMIGVAVFAAALSGLCTFYWMRRQTRRQAPRRSTGLPAAAVYRQTPNYMRSVNENPIII